MHRRTYAVIVLNFLVGAVAMHILSTALYNAGEIPEYCRGSVIRCIADLFRSHWADDSWGPMLIALQNFAAQPHVSIYQSTFFAMHVKFQYALATLIPFWGLERVGVTAAGISAVLAALSRPVVLATNVVGVAVAVRTAGGKKDPIMLVAIALLGLGFYPVMWAFQIGQITLYGNLFFCLAFFFFLGEQYWLTGLLIGALVLMKPQFGVVIIWALLRRRWVLARAALIVVGVGAALSLIIFGWENNLEYLRVLSFMSHHGEVYFPNQSINGFLNRLFMNGSSVKLRVDTFPTYQPAVYFLTLLSSAVIAIYGLLKKFCNPIADFSFIALAATAASPIAWFHHYGIALPIFIWLFVRFERSPWLLILTYVLLSNDPRITNLAADRPIVNVLQSAMLAGVLLLLWILQSERLNGLLAGLAGTAEKPTWSGSLAQRAVSFSTLVATLALPRQKLLAAVRSMVERRAMKATNSAK